MAEEKKSNIKIKLLEDWNLAGVEFYRKGRVVEVEPANYESMRRYVKHEVVK